MAPGESFIVSDQTYNGISIEQGSSFDLFFTAYAPNQQFDSQPEDNTVSTQINFDPTTSTRSIVSNPTFTIFPNPTSGLLTIRSNNQQIIETVSIYDLTGRLIIAEKPRTKQWEKDLSKLTAGSYMVKISTAQSIGYQKIIKQ